MKAAVGKHTANVAIGGGVSAAALGVSSLIGNAVQQAASLHLHGTALALYLLPFSLAAGASLVALIRLEASRLVKDAGPLLKMGAGLLAGGALNPTGTKAPATPPPPPPPAS